MSSDEKMTEDEKVCLTGKQIENIGKAYAKNFPAPKKDEVCKKADKWVKGFFKKGKHKKEPKDPLESYLHRKVISKIEGWADGFF